DDFAFARRLVLAQLSLAVIESPGTDRARRRVAGQYDANAVIARREVILFFAIALAGLHQVAELVDAEIADDVLGPAQARGVALQPLLGGEHAVAAAGRDLAQEIGFAAEQAETVLDLPGDVKVAGARKLGERHIVGRKRDQNGQEDEKTHGLWAEAHCNLVAPALRQKCEGRQSAGINLRLRRSRPRRSRPNGAGRAGRNGETIRAISCPRRRCRPGMVPAAGCWRR